MSFKSVFQAVFCNVVLSALFLVLMGALVGWRVLFSFGVGYVIFIVSYAFVASLCAALSAALSHQTWLRYLYFFHFLKLIVVVLSFIIIAIKTQFLILWSFWGYLFAFIMMLMAFWLVSENKQSE